VRSIFTPPFRRAFAGNFFSEMSFAMFVHFPGFLAGLGAGEAVIGLIAAVAAAAAIVARPWAGQGMDRYGRIPLVRLAALMRIGATVSLLLVNGIGPLVFVLRAVYTVALAVYFTGLLTYASDVMPPERRAQGIAWYGMSGMTAATFSAALGGVLIDSFGYPGLFIGMAIAELCALAITLTLKPLSNRPPLAPKEGALSIIGYRPLLPVWVLTIGIGLGFGGVLTFMRTFVDAIGVGSVGLYFSTYATTALITRLALSWVPDRFGMIRTAYPSVVFTAAGLGMLAFTTSASDIVIAAILGGLGHAFVFPILGALAAARAPEERRGVALSVYTAMFDLGPLIGAPLLGLMIERTGYTEMFLILSASVLISLLAFGRVDARVMKPAAGSIQPA
jgi:MFS family permease